MAGSVDHWRDSKDYRSEYFKQNPGFFGILWFCSQCRKPLIGKSKVQVDHIVPPSRYSKKKYDRSGKLVKNNSVLARMLNTKLNLVACCEECNKKKSAKVGLVTVNGAVSKVGEVAAFGAYKVAIVGIALGIKGSYFVVTKGAKVLTKPFRSKQPLQVKLLVAAAYVGFVWYIFSRV
nr:hypothetical protein [uncultured bacterium]